LHGHESTATWELHEAPGQPIEISYRMRPAGPGWTLSLGVRGERHDVRLRDLTPSGCRVLLDGIERSCTVTSYDDGSTWVGDAEHQTGLRQLPRLPEAIGATARGPVASIPGTVIAVNVAAGDDVEAGQVMVVLEAMKMEHQLRAEAGGQVEEVLVTVGQFVDAEAPLVRMSARGTG
jgi:acetyl/propionyl-CoA carboxylase alpha subunit